MSNSSQKENFKSGIWNFVREMIPVMLGVYFAFALNDYSEQRKINSQFLEYKALITEEVKQNLKNIEPCFEYHKKFKEELISLAKSDEPYAAFENYKMKGLRPGFVSKSAYQTGIQTGIIQEFELNMIQDINNLYTFQSNYDEYNKSLLEGFISKDIPKNDDEVVDISRNLIMSMNDVIISEENLIKYYNAILQKLK